MVAEHGQVAKNLSLNPKASEWPCFISQETIGGMPNVGDGVVHRAALAVLRIL